MEGEAVNNWIRRSLRGAACVVCAVALGALAAGAPAQDEKLPKWRVDPFTKNDPKAMEKAGYVSFGPFPFGNLGPASVQNTEVDKHLHYARLIWAETKHFRIGMDLPAWVVPMDPETKGKIRTELEELAKVVPGVNPKTRTLEPWLRMHLYAQRLENLFDEFCAMAGVKPEEFPPDPSKVVIQPGARYMGQGPYLGMKDKFLVLLVEKEGTYRDYLKHFIGRDSKYGQRWHCKDVGSLLFAVSAESEEGRLKHDTAMHCTVAFNVGQNLLDGFRHYSYDLPVWIREGLGHWFERRVDPKWNSFDQNEGSPADMKTTWKWEPIARRLATAPGKCAPFPDAYTWRDFGKLTFEDHVAVWSRIDFLLAQDHAKWSKFLFAVKGRVDAQWVPDQSDLVGATRDALQAAYGISVLQFDEKWAEWAKEKYPAQ